MITVIFKTDKGIIKSFEISGHSLYGSHGEDIVCAGVTSAVRYFECMANDVLGASLPFSVNEKKAEIQAEIPEFEDAEKGRFVQYMLNSLFTYLLELGNEYPENIKISKI